VADAVSLAPREVFLILLQPLSDVGHIDLYHSRSVWRSALAAYHVFSNGQAHAAGCDYLFLWARHCGSRRRGRNKFGHYRLGRGWNIFRLDSRCGGCELSNRCGSRSFLLLRKVGKDVFLADTSTDSCACNCIQVDVMLTR